MKLDMSGHEAFAPHRGELGDLSCDLSAPPVFDLPNCPDFDGFQKKAVQMVKPAKGTTTLAFIFKEGAIVAADSRASMGGYIYIIMKCQSMKLQSSLVVLFIMQHFEMVGVVELLVFITWGLMVGRSFLGMMLVSCIIGTTQLLQPPVEQEMSEAPIA